MLFSKSTAPPRAYVGTSSTTTYTVFVIMDNTVSVNLLWELTIRRYQVRELLQESLLLFS